MPVVVGTPHALLKRDESVASCLDDVDDALCDTDV